MANELTQNVTIVAGQTYRLRFDADITSGVLRVFQGTQQIYDTSIATLSTPREQVYITEKITLVRIGPAALNPSTFDTVTVSENIEAITTFFTVRDIVTITENIVLTVI